jgi:hypothetical protein
MTANQAASTRALSGLRISAGVARPADLGQNGARAYCHGGGIDVLSFEFDTTLIHWRGPSPYFFAPIPVEHGAEIRRVSKLVTYGWGVIPVEAEISGTRFTTSLFPRDESYLLPVKNAVRHRIGITAGDPVTVRMSVRSGR